MRRAISAAAGLIAAAAAALPAAGQDAPAANDYPTETRAEFVFACMAVNGQTREALRRCACSIDVIASILPHERYVDAETVLAMRQAGGERVGVMRTTPSANAMVENLRRAEAEADVRCF